MFHLTEHPTSPHYNLLSSEVLLLIKPAAAHPGCNPRRVPEMHDRDKTKPKTRLESLKQLQIPKTKLQARGIANDCYRYMMNLCTNAGIVSDA